MDSKEMLRVLELETERERIEEKNKNPRRRAERAVRKIAPKVACEAGTEKAQEFYDRMERLYGLSPDHPAVVEKGIRKKSRDSNSYSTVIDLGNGAFASVTKTTYKGKRAGDSPALTMHLSDDPTKFTDPDSPGRHDTVYLGSIDLKPDGEDYHPQFGPLLASGGYLYHNLTNLFSGMENAQTIEQELGLPAELPQPQPIGA